MSKKWIPLAMLALSPYLYGAEAAKKEAAVDAKAEKVEAKVEAKTEVKSAPVVDVDKVSETLGHLIVRHLDNPGFKFNIEKIVLGIKDEREGKPAPMSEEEYEQMIAQIQENIFTQMAEKNLGDANAFLEKNSKEEGIVAINPKLQYKVSKQGEGEGITADATPLVHYTGKLLDGTVFSSSVESGKPISLPIKQTIAGFSEGLAGMKKGEKRTLYIHPELAYGVSGQLPPNSLLIFEVEIVETDAKTADATKASEAVAEIAAPKADVKAEETVQKPADAIEQKPTESAQKAEASKKQEVTQKDVKHKGKHRAKK